MCIGHLYSNNYAISTAVLAHSVRSVNSTARLILLYIDGQVSEEAPRMSRAAGWELLAVPRIAPPEGGKGGLDKHGIDRLVYLDADALVRRNFDELFDLPFNFAAVPDVYGPDNVRGFSLTFNAGVMAIQTSSAVLEHMKKKIGTARYPIGQAEYAFLNLYFGAKAVRLPYIYNALLSIKKRSLAVWDELKSDLSVVHYTNRKPFLLESQPGEKILTPEETETEMDIA
ncbi:nucleotide-diphospho-sugar transferase [Pleurotus eryngii]|uniref:Nucleotide-diphospho-sugar transferase n=1 Tax=Pleurotus eryngii TaxID=5323 RepID=A0A9P5ZV51_PLEER|nr:nucleotide-diphospho-sugar transferase [Pleurotus eryngii]